jgi:hypothetical protein
MTHATAQEKPSGDVSADQQHLCGRSASQLRTAWSYVPADAAVPGHPDALGGSHERWQSTEMRVAAGCSVQSCERLSSTASCKPSAVPEHIVNTFFHPSLFRLLCCFTNLCVSMQPPRDAGAVSCMHSYATTYGDLIFQCDSRVTRVKVTGHRTCSQMRDDSAEAKPGQMYLKPAGYTGGRVSVCQTGTWQPNK